MIGAGNPCPFQVGGGLTDTEAAYRSLRDAVGTGGSAPDDAGIEGLWRRSEAHGVAAATSAERRALLQAFPNLATDLLPAYERLLGIVPPTGSSEAQRAKVVAQLYYEKPIATLRELEEALQDIDPRFSIRDVPDEHSGVTQHGRAFEAHAGATEGQPFNLARRHVQYPNWSTRQIERVRFDAGYDGPLTISDKRLVERAQKLLRKALGSDVDFTISKGPWRVGVTPIGLGEV